MAERPGMSRRLILRGLLLGGAGAGLAACGVPSSGKPHIDGEGPSSGGQGGSNANLPPPSPVGITEPTDFVRKFLTALAAPSDEQSRAAAIRNAKTFLTTRAQSDWQADPNTLTIVRVVNPVPPPVTTPDGTTIDVDLVLVGQLMASGWVRPQPQNKTSARFTLVRNDSGQTADATWHIDSPLPPVLAHSLLLSSEGLSAPLYYPQLIYYWDATTAGLVPDLRYLPSVGLLLEQQPTQIVKWLINGPSDWLEPAVTPLPAGTSLVLPNVAKANNSWVVDFANLQNVDPAHVAAQLQWSLRPNFTERVSLQIASQEKQVDSARFQNANLADAPNRGDATPYFIVNGQVREGQAPYTIPKVFSKVNDPNVVLAALSRDLSLGAVVREVKVGGKNRYRLAIGRLATADAAQGPDFVEVGQLPAADTMSRPVWLNAPTPRLLVAVNGGLFMISPAGQPTRVPINDDFDNTISAFSVAPDGRRLALITGRGPAVASLTFTTDAVVVGPPTVIDAGGLTALTAVSWSRVHCLALAGKSATGGFGLIEVTLDGAIAAALYNGTFGSPVVQLSCYPPLPSRTLSSPGPVRVQTQNRLSYEVILTNAPPLSYVPPQPSPSTTTGTTPAAAQNPIAPFYVD